MLKIAICGIDGCGKSTLIHKLKECLNARGISAVSTRAPFPSKDTFAIIPPEKYRAEHEIVKRAGVAFDFIRHYKNISVNEDVLLCDRYEIDFEVLNDVYDIPNEYKDVLHSIYGQAPKIDIYIFLKADFSLAGMRLKQRGNRKDDENDEILQGMQSSFEKRFLKYTNVVIIDASKSEDEIADEALKTILELRRKNDKY